MRNELAFGGIGFAMGLMMSMYMKSDTYKERYGCRTCRYESKSKNYPRCRDCKRQKGTNWIKPVETCHCCGQELE
jgi:hypothetical protein